VILTRRTLLWSLFICSSMQEFTVVELLTMNWRKKKSDLCPTIEQQIKKYVGIFFLTDASKLVISILFLSWSFWFLQFFNSISAKVKHFQFVYSNQNSLSFYKSGLSITFYWNKSKLNHCELSRLLRTCMLNRLPFSLSSFFFSFLSNLTVQN
jgi:hypothetical protein